MSQAPSLETIDAQLTEIQNLAAWLLEQPGLSRIWLFGSLAEVLRRRRHQPEYAYRINDWDLVLEVTGQQYFHFMTGLRDRSMAEPYDRKLLRLALAMEQLSPPVESDPQGFARFIYRFSRFRPTPAGDPWLDLFLFPSGWNNRRLKEVAEALALGFPEDAARQRAFLRTIVGQAIPFNPRTNRFEV